MGLFIISYLKYKFGEFIRDIKSLITRVIPEKEEFNMRVNTE